MKKNVTLLMAILTLVVFAFSGTAVAGNYGKSGKTCGDMAISLAMMIYENQDELAVTDEQIAKIKELKLAYKKALVQKKADIEIKGIDIKSLLWEETVDTVKINSLIDEKYEIKKAKAKLKVNTYSEIKNVLTPEQKEMLKDICKKSCPKGKGYSSKKEAQK